MIERLVIVTVIILFALIVFRIFKNRQLRQITNFANVDPLLEQTTQGIPTIVYFTTPTCVTCRTQQQPILQQVMDELGKAVQVVKVDATEQPEDADRWGVFSAPTTFILDRDRKPAEVNYGLVDRKTLVQQLKSVA